MNNIEKYPKCHMRTSLGNCNPVGGFCTSVNESICEALHKVNRSQRELVGCTGCEYYDQQQTRLICHDCKRYYSDKYKGGENE